MDNTSNSLLTVRRPLAVGDRDRRGVRLPTGASSTLFGGWGVRF